MLTLSIIFNMFITRRVYTALRITSDEVILVVKGIIPVDILKKR